ncbi:inositol monophosphatase family protein [Corynebacterium sp. TA-R-1]|uniref:Inositol monophosphatase family protein n=1 Tax=Corynebacterium stercoris TaxID=2943490 RepID=A0ABT1G136_9CORY|nr:inositol monophosphatase family protein [Corynebacterium stercoris]MCP1386673.1 inositol monophosphatase family protein [Corynebacterium stercoris]
MLSQYAEIALAAADEARDIFVDKLGAAPALVKGKGDFATEADLAIEQLLRERLGEATGIPVFGEEQGGKLDPEACWVVDPIDGTSNYSSGNPNCAILIALIQKGQPVLAVTDIPLLGMRLHTVGDGPVMLNGEVLPAIGQETAAAAQIGVGSVGSDDRQRFPAQVRLDLVGALAETELRPRICGSVGVDLAFVALGIYQAAVSFSPHIWDNAAGVLLGRNAGGVVTDVTGEEWRIGAAGAISGTPAAHRTALSTMLRVQ